MPPKVQDMPPGGPSAHPAASTPNGPKHKYSNAEKRAYRESRGLPKKKSKATKAKAKAKRAKAKAKAKTRRDEWARLTPQEKQVKKEASETAFHAKHSNWSPEQWNRRQEKYDKWRAQETKKYQERQAKREQKYQDDIAQAEDENHAFEESQERAEDDKAAFDEYWGKPEERKASYEEYERQAEAGGEYIDGEWHKSKKDYLGGGKAAQMRNKSVTPPEDDGLFEHDKEYARQAEPGQFPTRRNKMNVKPPKEYPKPDDAGMSAYEPHPEDAALYDQANVHLQTRHRGVPSEYAIA